MQPYRLSESDRQIYRRYAGLALPRHTSYPIAPVWTSDFGPAQFRDKVRGRAASGQPLSLYVHIPFCERLCYYCACTKEIVSPKQRGEHDPSAAYLGGLAVETARFAQAAGPRLVRQVQLGGGSPTFLKPEQLRQLWSLLSEHFSIAADAEIAVEIDPRITTLEHLRALREVGFNRVSLGIQDFDERVQQAVNRHQPFEVVQRVVGWCRTLGFGSINFDLIYSLPYQTLDSMADTLERTIDLGPDRIAFYRLAVIPEIFRWQNVFRRADLPSGDLPLDLNLLAINRFQQAGYEFIGLDHFARPDEALAVASRDKTLRRNFQGMTTGQDLEILGLGPSAITHLDDAFAQNVKTSGEWLQQAAGDFATERGLALGADDRLRRDLIQQLYCHGVIEKRPLESRFGVSFDDHFAAELERLRTLIDEGLAEVDGDQVRLTTPLGRLLVRVVAAVFDRYLPPDAFRVGLPAHMSSRVG